mmetsp:Transcript_28724/g.70034  ORF Transcript_28724/g.70034 Transcript_28724/m.70034 type:complete len:243 (-) Transcript_28724:930-1658(-)
MVAHGKEVIHRRVIGGTASTFGVTERREVEPMEGKSYQLRILAMPQERGFEPVEMQHEYPRQPPKLHFLRSLDVFLALWTVPRILVSENLCCAEGPEAILDGEGLLCVRLHPSVANIVHGYRSAFDPLFRILEVHTDGLTVANVLVQLALGGRRNPTAGVRVGAPLDTAADPCRIYNGQLERACFEVLGSRICRFPQTRRSSAKRGAHPSIQCARWIARRNVNQEGLRIQFRAVLVVVNSAD